MFIPNGAIVRAAKQILADSTARFVANGASQAINRSIGSILGRFYNAGNSRIYLNTLGEIANNTMSSSARKIASRDYANAHKSRARNGGYTVYIPGGYGQRGQSIPYSVAKENLPFRFDNKNNFSQCELLNDALSDICKVGYDFSLKDILKVAKSRFEELFQKSKQTETEFGQNVIKACYEYLEENGYDGYSTMVDILTNNIVTDDASKRDFSEGEVGMSDIEMFKVSAQKYAQLTEDQKVMLHKYLENQLGTKVACEYLFSMSKYNSTKVPPTANRLRMFKTLSVLFLTFSGLKKLFTRPRPVIDSNGQPTKQIVINV